MTETYAVAFFDRATDNRPEPRELTLRQLNEILTSHEFREKKDGPLFSPTAYEPGATRRNTNVRALTLAVGDFDDGTDPEIVREHLARLGVAFWIYSTHSSSPAHPKFRAVVPLAQPVPADRWGAVWPALVRELFLGRVDLGTRDASRLFYLPSAPPGATPFVYRGDGVAFDWSTLRLDPETRRRPLTLPGDESPIATGERRPKLMSIAGRLRNAGAGYDAILAEIRAVNETRCVEKLTERELEHIARSACRYEPGHSRPVTPAAPPGPTPPTSDRAAAPAPTRTEGGVLLEVDFRPCVKIRQTEAGVFWVRPALDKKGKKDEDEYPVIAGELRAHRRISVEGQLYVEAEVLLGQRITTTVPALLARLDAMGRILDHGRARDVLPALLYHAIKRTETSHPTWGFYADGDGRIVECQRPTPVRPEQDARWATMESAVGRGMSRDDLQAYVTFLGHYRPYESLPVLGSAVAAPLAFLARSRRELVAHVLSFSKTSGLGKTSLAEALSDDLFLIRPATGPALNSEFRWPAHLDCVCGPLAVNEAQGLNWKAIGASFKASAESMVADRRGRPDQTMDEYMSRLVALMTSNAAPPLTPTEMVRVILIHMDESAKFERERDRVAFETAANALRGRAIGPALARMIIRELPTVDAFMRRRSELAASLATEAVGAGFSFGDGRRPGAWAHVYIGLEAFDRACRENGVDWALPPVARFLADVVIPVERGAAEAEVTALQLFRAFVANYRVDHTVRQVETTERGVVVDAEIRLKAKARSSFRTPSMSGKRRRTTPRSGLREIGYRPRF
jgi:hypothetical protein